MGCGDYPHLPDVPVEQRDPWYPYDFPELKRNFQEPVKWYKNTFLPLSPPGGPYPLKRSKRTLKQISNWPISRFTLSKIYTMKLDMVHLHHYDFRWKPCTLHSSVWWRLGLPHTSGWITRKCFGQLCPDNYPVMDKFIIHSNPNRKMPLGEWSQLSSFNRFNQTLTF